MDNTPDRHEASFSDHDSVPLDDEPELAPDAEPVVELEPEFEDFDEIEAIEEAEEYDAPPPTAPDLSPVLARLDEIEYALGQMTTGFQQLAQQVSLLPQQIRGINTRVESLTTSISDVRVNDLLDRFVEIYDFTEKLADTTDPGVAHSTQMIQKQIVQVLQVNGIKRIPTDGHFDETLHRVLAVEACDTPEEDGEIIRCPRAGFFTEHRVLRYADVIIKQYSDEQEKIDS